MLFLQYDTRYATFLDILGQPFTVCWVALFAEIMLVVVVHFPVDAYSTGCGLVGLLLQFFILQIFLWLSLSAMSFHLSAVQSWIAKNNIRTLAGAIGE